VTEPAAPGRAETLVLAVAHEVANLLAAVRLQAHLLDAEAGPRALAAAGVEIEDLTERAAALLALVRPVLARPAAARRVAPAHSLDDIRTRALGWRRGVALSVQAAPDVPDVRVDADALLNLLLCWVAGALDDARPAGRVRLSAHAEPGRAVFELEDDGEPAEDPGLWTEASLRGRVLSFALGAELARRAGGGAEARRTEGRTRARLWLPVLEDGS
jgi:nitrogen-specific signal transduction histidine kinase